jgi:predicted transcriptional regulator
MKLLETNGTSLATMGLGATAAEVMTLQPLSISDDAILRDAAAFLTTKRITAAPIIDKAGRPVGVISLSDIARHACREGASAALDESTTVRDVMTPGVLFVRPGTSLEIVMEDLLKFGVHRLFVIDWNEVLVGVISTFDVLRHVRSLRGRMLHPNTDFECA